MADYHKRELTTADDVPISELLDYGVQLFEEYREAPRGFIDRISTEVSSRIFRTHTGDMRWDELGEMEHARTGDISSQEMAFSINKYGRSLGFSREFIEDNPSELVRERFEHLLRGARDREFESVFDVMTTGIANGTELTWYDIPDYGAYSFSQDHNHTFATTQELFEADGDTDTAAHTPSDHIREANKELRHHGKRPDVAIMGHDLANEFVRELSLDSDYYIPEAEGLRTTALPETALTSDGVAVLQTSWLTGDDFYVFASQESPIKVSRPRPIEITDNTGNPIGGQGGARGDPGALLGAYGSGRWGVKMVDPLTGVKCTADNVTTT